MKLFWTYIRSIRGTLAIFFGFFAMLLISFALYGLPLEAVIYPILLCIILGLAYLLYRFHVLSEWHREISRLKNMTAEQKLEVVEDYNLGPNSTNEDYKNAYNAITGGI